LRKSILLICVLLAMVSGAFAEEKIFGKPRAKNWISNETYFTYEFSKRPAIGMTVVKIKVFDKTNKRTNDYAIVGVSGMPSMGNAHDSTETTFKQNKKGDYLMPVNIVMLGEWEVRLKFLKDKNEIFSGTIRFNVK
jgi:hypothetical protein